MNSDLQQSISTSLAYYLRHDTTMPHDESGWVPLERVLEEVNNDYSEDITTADLQTIIKNSDKQRYQIRGDEMRALYGHNEKLDILVDAELISDPDVLYHGTPVRNLSSIMEKGLQPQSRQRVHLTPDRELAFTTGVRHTQSPEEKVVLLQIDPEGVQNLAQPNEDIYVGDTVPPQYITEVERKVVTD